jgi:hypothetical protein
MSTQGSKQLAIAAAPYLQEIIIGSLKRNRNSLRSKTLPLALHKVLNDSQ